MNENKHFLELIIYYMSSYTKAVYSFYYTLYLIADCVSIAIERLWFRFKFNHSAFSLGALAGVGHTRQENHVFPCDQTFL